MLSVTHLLVALMPSGLLRVRNIVELAALRTPSDSPSSTWYLDVYLSADGYIKALGLMRCPTTTTSLTPCAGMRMLPLPHKDTSIGPLSVKCSAETLEEWDDLAWDNPFAHNLDHRALYLDSLRPVQDNEFGLFGDGGFDNVHGASFSAEC